MGVKYNGLIVFLILTLFIPFIRSRHGSRNYKDNSIIPSAVSAVYFCIIALLVFSPWMIRNYKLTSNPIFPIFNSLILKDVKESDDFTDPRTLRVKIADEVFSETAHSKGPFLMRRLAFNETIMEISLIPIRIFFEGQDDDPRHFDGKLNPFLIILPLIAFTVGREKTKQLNTEKKILLYFSIVYLLIVYFKADMRIRYITPIIPPLVILSAIGLYQLKSFLQETAIGTFRSAVPLLLAGCIVIILYQN